MNYDLHINDGSTYSHMCNRKNQTRNNCQGKWTRSSYISRIYLDSFLTSSSQFSSCGRKSLQISETVNHIRFYPTIMDVKPERYLDFIAPQVRDATELLDKIKNDGTGRAPIVVDVGCGSGNITKLLCDTVPHDRLVSFDIDPAMVNFSRQNLQNTGIEFLVQDVGVPWEDVHETLKSLEGKVDLVFSNRVLHWVPMKNRVQALKNIVKLLKPGGRFYANITRVPNFNELLPREERERNEELVKVPTSSEQLVSWITSLAAAELVSVDVKLIEKSWDFQIKDPFADDLFEMLYLSYVTEAVAEDSKITVLKSFRDLVKRHLVTPHGDKILVDNAEEATGYYYAQIRVSAMKKQ